MVKVATKGQREIAEGNAETLKQFGAASVVASAIPLVLALTLWELGSGGWTGWVLCFLSQALALVFMKAVSGTKKDAKGHVVDAGMDLNDPEAMGEPCKDIVILTCGVQLLALLSNYFFLLLLAAPAYGGYKLAVKIIIPWATAPPATDEAADEKKMRKRERRMRM